MAYLLDANVFIQAKNLHYGLDFCPAFWEWLIAENTAGSVFSIEKVGDEVQAVADDLAEWAKDRGDGFFVPPDAALLPALAAVSGWAAGQKYEQAAISTFLQVADYYLVAHAHAGRHVVVTHEVPSASKQTVQDQAEMNRHLNPGVDRYRAKTEEEQEEFKNVLGAFVRLYAFLSQIMPFSDPDLEKLYTFARFFETKLPQDPKKAPLRLDGDVALRYYRLDKISEGTIALRLGEPGVVYSRTEVGTHKAKEDEAQLSEIIGVLNERFGTKFKQDDQILFDQFVAAAKLDGEVVQRAKANPLDNFALAMKGKMEGLMIDRMDQNEEIVTRYLNDPQFQDVAFQPLVRRIYDEIRGGDAPAP